MEQAIIISGADLQALIKNAVNEALEQHEQRKTAESSEKVFGLRGIANLFGCSIVTAHKYKNTFLAPAVRQIGRKIVTDTAKAQQLFAQHAEKENRELRSIV
ncbi:MAG: DUF3853 family protein [Prevotellaceae bacterium]|jgi:hypothetical protein|nr:DUF3853 family protein [Prevotellaceae bacterium]DAR96696.1 MAG TPA: Protein of unknown function (DUF3853) [Caudoviricetes sp.]